MTPADTDARLDAPTRRRRDGEGTGSRALVWGERHTDVLLLPHSPLALADVLASDGGRFDLLPLANEGETSPGAAFERARGDGGADVHPISAGRPGADGAGRRRSRRRTNLLSRLERGALRERCRAAIVEAALVRRRDERRLYLAAGFLRGDGLDAPLLLYPALLVCKADDSGHELRLADIRAEVNHLALDHCAKRFGHDLPLPSAGQPLDDYFAQLAATVATIDGLDFAFETAIGNSDAAFLAHAPNPAGLPDVPPRFDAQLAMALASDVSLEELHTLLQLMPQAGAGDDMQGNDDGAAVDNPVARLRDCSVKLAARELDHCDFAMLAELPDTLDGWGTAVRAAAGCATVTGFFADHRISVAQLARLGSIIELIDKAPPGIDDARHADLAFESTAQLLRRAHHQAQLIEDEFATLQNDFLLDRLPSKSDLLDLMDRIATAPGPGVVDADYFHARRQFMEFSVAKPAQLEDGHRRQLGQLVKLMRFRELFVNNTEYRRALGSGYRGLRTDWTALTALVDYARELANELGSESLAAMAVTDFAGFRQSLVGDLDALRRGAEALRAAEPVFGRHWQQRDAASAVAHLADTCDRLRSLQRRFGTFAEHAGQTPATVLSQFTGESRLDGRTERRVRDARARIDHALRSGDSDALAVADTLAWLRTASQRASDHQLDIAAIVDHLQIA